MSKRIVISTLYLVGSTLDMTGIQSHTPKPKHKPSAEVVENYIHAKWYNPMRSSQDWNRSEQRKAEILQSINNIRIQIRKQAARVSERAEKHVVDAESYNTYKERKTLYRASVLVNRAMEHLADIG